MTKERTNISIDKEILAKAKKQIPNLSEFIEKCLKQYLGLEPNLIPTSDINELTTQISECQLQIQLINEQNNAEENLAKAEKLKLQKTWIKAYGNYAQYGYLEPAYVQEASKVFDIPEDVLTALIKHTSMWYRTDGVNDSDFEEVKATYLDEVMEEMNDE